MSPAGPASLWTRDKSHILSRAQRQPGQMAWKKAYSVVVAETAYIGEHLAVCVHLAVRKPEKGQEWKDQCSWNLDPVLHYLSYL